MAAIDMCIRRFGRGAVVPGAVVPECFDRLRLTHDTRQIAS